MSHAGSITRHTMLAAGPDQSWAATLVRPLDSIGYVYASLATYGEDERDGRGRALAATLRQQGAPPQVVTALAERFRAASPAPARLAAFASAEGTIVYARRLPLTEEGDVAEYGVPPALIPLLDADQDRPPYLFVVIDRTGADLSGSRGGDQPLQTWSVVGPDDEIERNAPRGWSQPRYQRRAEDSWMHNARRVAAEVTARVSELGAQVLAISGDVRAVRLFTEALPDDSGLLVAHLTGSRALDGSQPGRSEALAEVLHSSARAQTQQLLDRFQAHLDPGGLAVAGPAATVAALASGRVATLLVTDEPDDAAQAWFGAGATDIYPDHDTAAATGRPVHVGRLVDVAIRAALLSDAHVRIVAADLAGGPAGGIGAICRFGTR